MFKSTLLNTLIGKEVMKTQMINEKSKEGKHTTTHSELFHIGGFNIIDIPGMRTFTSWLDSENPQVFAEIIELSKGCKYRNCNHTGEDGCNVVDNVEEALLNSYHKYQNMQLYLESKSSVSSSRKYSKKVKERIKLREK